VARCRGEAAGRPLHQLHDLRLGDLLFAYYEYTGDDYAADIAAIAADLTTQQW
jgi:L-rhamnose mutarotase